MNKNLNLIIAGLLFAMSGLTENNSNSSLNNLRTLKTKIECNLKANNIQKNNILDAENLLKEIDLTLKDPQKLDDNYITSLIKLVQRALPTILINQKRC